MVNGLYWATKTYVMPINRRNAFTLLFSIFIIFHCESQTQFRDTAIQKRTVLLKNPDGGHASGVIIKYNNKYLLCTASHVMSQLGNKTQILYSNLNHTADSTLLLNIASAASVPVSHLEGDVSILLLHPRNNIEKALLNSLYYHLKLFTVICLIYQEI